ncbi:IS66 family transposase zinc-finger binding domain-containing protein [Paracoccus sp. (in: a-proteobacteria)]|uniref:IS66 family transposase zinc-finger binding domain-containing protein n=1 Tax=Paracoccus sp. TaxID=267 RepID=UPI003A8B23EC
MNRDDLEKLSKDELVEAYLALQERLGRPGKTSRTSSKPPSTDRKARRAKSKPGGAKPGHEGRHRRLAENPDRIIDHRSGAYSGCGAAITADAPGAVIGECYRIDIPPITPVVERHRRLSCACPSCGVKTKAPVSSAISRSCPCRPMHPSSTRSKTSGPVSDPTNCRSPSSTAATISSAYVATHGTSSPTAPAHQLDHIKRLGKGQ